jgi:hypothetical protein
MPGMRSASITLAFVPHEVVKNQYAWPRLSMSVTTMLPGCSKRKNTRHFPTRKR